MTGIRCFVLEPTDRACRSLRRYNATPRTNCPLPLGYHNAMVPFDERTVKLARDGSWSVSEAGAPPHRDPRWPTHCACGYAFAPHDTWQLFTDRLYRRSDTGAITTLREAEPGALWRATWLEDWTGQCGTDGQAWVCKTPGGEWHIDGRASNCTMPSDTIHKCWCRHGIAPDFHVDKVGVTCQAGAGSIAQPGYHGFLHQGHLKEA